MDFTCSSNISNVYNSDENGNCVTIQPTDKQEVLNEMNLLVSTV